MIRFLRHILSTIKKDFVLFNYDRQFPNSNIGSLLNESWKNKIQPYTIIESNCILKGEIDYLGLGLYIGQDTLIYSCKSIGKFCSISSGVKIGLVAHPKDLLSTSPLLFSMGRGFVKEQTQNYVSVDKKVIIEHDVLISANVLVLNGVKIGTGAIIGAGAIVTKDVPPYAIVVGVPGKVVGYRFSEDLIPHLLESKWWELPLEDIVKLPYLRDVSRIKDSFNL